MNRKKILILAIAVSSILFIASACLRMNQFSETKSIENLDASYHVLLTSKALEQTPWQVHRFLPIVTLGKDADKNISWGATVPDPKGNYYYTSFGSLGFLAPYFAFKLTGMKMSLLNLLKFNLAIHYLSSILFIFLIWQCLEPLITSQFRLFFTTIFAAALYIFSLESLYSHGVIYWHHSLWNLVWICQLLYFQKLIINRYVQHDYTKYIYIALSVISPLVEWTGFIGNIVLAFLPIMVFGNKQKKQFLFRELLITTLLIAPIIIFIHYSTVIGIKPLINALESRFLARNFSQGLSSFGLFKRLILGYIESFGLTTILIALIALPFFKTISEKTWNSQWIVFKLTLFASSIVLLENILMLEHAGGYHFDRLKAVIPITLLAVGLGGLASRRWSKLVFAALVVSIAINVYNFTAGLREKDVSNIFKDNDRLMLTLKNEVNSCALWALNDSVRGWVNLSLNRGVFENVSNIEQLSKLVKTRRACQGVLLISSPLYDSGIYHFLKAYIYQPDNHQVKSISLDKLGNVNTNIFPISASKFDK